MKKLIVLGVICLLLVFGCKNNNQEQPIPKEKEYNLVSKKNLNFTFDTNEIEDLYNNFGTIHNDFMSSGESDILDIKKGNTKEKIQQKAWSYLSQKYPLSFTNDKKDMFINSSNQYFSSESLIEFKV